MTDQMDTGNEERWRDYLNGTDPAPRAGRALWVRLPSPPRCELCAAPFRGPFVPLLRLIGMRPFTKNPRYCDFCVSRLMKGQGGAMVDRFISDQIVGYFVPLYAPTHARNAIARASHS